MNKRPAISDQDIITGCLEDDRSLQAELVKRFSNLVYGAVQGVFKMKHSPFKREDLEDLHNTAFVALFEKKCKKLRQYKGHNGCSLASWIRMIAVRTTLDHIRRTRDALARPERVVPLELIKDQASESSESPAAVLDKGDEARLIKEGLSCLAPRDRLFIQLHCYDGLSVQQVACVLDMTVNTAHSVKHRAVHRLKAVIEKNREIEKRSEIF